jgi:Tol biopolymer transport system component/predicted Ser/Thr protein kinase
MTLNPGARLGPHEVIAKLGEGGMGEVYKARDTRLDRTVAIKVLPKALGADPHFTSRFDREARVISQLTHPHICTLYDVGEQEGTAYLVMEYLEGQTLADRLTKGPLTLDHALRTAAEIASALEKAHRAGIVHRDLKPGNIMLTKAGAKLLDFGIAKSMPAATGASVSVAPTTPAGLTAQGTILGTFQYMAPEQVEGLEADPRTDIFAFGAVLHEMVTGKKAFEGKSQASLLAAIMHVDPPSLASVLPLTPPLLDRVVRRCLAKNPDERFQSASDVLAALRWIDDPAAGSAGVAAKPVRIRPLDMAVRIAAVALAFACIALAALYISGLRSDASTATGGASVVSRLTVVLPADAPLFNAVGSGLALSPDGSEITYVGSGAAGTQIYRRALDRLDVTPIPGTEGAAAPFYAPDGQWLGFRQGRALKKIGRNGAIPSTIAEVPFIPSRGATWTGDDVIYYGILGGDLWRVPAAGGSAAVVAGLQGLEREKEITRRFPHALPDGKTLLYVALPTSATAFAGGFDFNAAQIVALNVETGERTVLLTGGFGPQYAPSGHLIFAREDGLYAAPFDLPSLRLRGDAVKVIDGVQTFSGNGFAHFAVSTTGALVYAPGVDIKDFALGTTVVWVDRSGRERPLAHWSNSFNQMRLSADGTRLLVHGNSAISDVGVYEIARGILTRLTSSPNGGHAPTWSPDGTQVAYSKPDPAFTAGPYEIVTRSTDGSGSERALVARPFPLAAESWSPDAKWIAFTETTDAGPDIWLLSAQGDGKPVAFATSPAAEQHPRFSPDGRWVAYQSNESGTDEIFVRPFPDAGGRYQVTSGGGVNPEWTPDGRELIYQHGIAVMRVSVTPGARFAAGVPTRLFERKNGGLLLAVGPEGREFVMSGSATQPPRPFARELVVIQNWTEELKRLVPATR